jgi:hypothetical protein
VLSSCHGKCRGPTLLLAAILASVRGERKLKKPEREPLAQETTVTTMEITRKNQWLAELAHMSKVIGNLNLATGGDVAYVEYVGVNASSTSPTPTT